MTQEKEQRTKITEKVGKRKSTMVTDLCIVCSPQSTSQNPATSPAILQPTRGDWWP